MNIATCKHCDRAIVEVDGAWIDPAATGDDSMWRETCDANSEDVVAAHEPAVSVIGAPRYPAVEDHVNGLYLRPQTTVTVLTTTVHDPTLPPSAPAQVTESHFVDATEFMAVQKEADDYRRVLSLIHAWRVTPARDLDRLAVLLAGVGFNDVLGQATRDIIAEFTSSGA